MYSIMSVMASVLIVAGGWSGRCIHKSEVLWLDPRRSSESVCPHASETRSLASLPFVGFNQARTAGSLAHY